MSEFTRRTFLKNTSKAVIVGGMMATSGRVFGANDRVGVAVMGVNGRGKSHIDGFGNKPDSDIVAMIDPDSRVLHSRIKAFAKETGNTPASYSDIREALMDKNIDALSIATPNHWHSLAAIWGVQAGRDVYVEKPLSHNIYEGRQLADLFAKSDRIVQHGTQSRSSGKWLRDIGLIHSGFLGKIHMGKGFTYKTGNRRSLGHGKPLNAPKHLDWTMWQGPARDKQYRKNYVHYNWHWFWEYGNGETGNQGVHQMDLAVWGMNRGLPVKVYSAGDRYHWDDEAETPNTQATTFTYEDGAIMIFEIRNYGSYQEAGALTTGNTFWGEHGYYVEGKGFFDMDHKAMPIPDGTETPATRGNWQNFIDSCKSRDKSSIFGDAEDGHIASAHCHLANAAYRLGHSLEIDTKTERFIGSEEGNAILTRRYREGFEVKPV